MVMSISIGQNPVQEMQKKQEATKSSEEVSLFPETLSPQTKDLMEAAQVVCQKISDQNFRSTTDLGYIDAKAYSLNHTLISDIRKIREKNDLLGAAKPATALSDFRYAYGSKTFSKLTRSNGSVVRFGNCGEKASSAFLNLIKRHSEKFHSIEIVTLYFRPAQENHVFVVLNRDQSEISIDPCQWRPMPSCDQVIVCDPSFNRVFLAKDYRQNMMVFEEQKMTFEGTVNRYTPYEEPTESVYCMWAHNRFEPGNPESNEFLGSYGMRSTAEERPAEERSREVQQSIKSLRNKARNGLDIRFKMLSPN